jgi:hypothetical protein
VWADADGCLHSEPVICVQSLLTNVHNEMDACLSRVINRKIGFPHAFNLPPLHLDQNDLHDSLIRGVPTGAYTMVSRPPRYSEAFG